MEINYCSICSATDQMPYLERYPDKGIKKEDSPFPRRDRLVLPRVSVGGSKFHLDPMILWHTTDPDRNSPKLCCLVIAEEAKKVKSSPSGYPVAACLI